VEKTLLEGKIDGIKSTAVLEQIKEASADIIESGNSAMTIAALYHITGIFCFILSIIGVFRQTGKKRFLLLPFGIIAGFIAIIVM